MSKLKHECGIVAYFSKNKDKNAVNEAINALIKLQHRGQDSCGVSYVENDIVKKKIALGLIRDNFLNLKIKSNIIIAHTRYATCGKVDITNAQPYLYNNVALCFNGTIYNVLKYKKILKENNFIFETDSDAEIILKWLFLKLKKDPSKWSLEEMRYILSNDFKMSAFSLLVLLKDKIFAFKDFFSFRPLIFIETKDNYILLSEDCAYFGDYIAKFELKAAQGVEINKNGYILSDYNKTNCQKQCVFEVVYFANKKSTVFDVDVKKTRIKLGRLLAKDDDISADIVIPVMNSGLWGAFGYSKEKNIELSFAIKNNKNILRTFIEKEPKRNIALDEKYSIIKNKVEGKEVVVVDDSIVRGNTVKKITSLLKENGVKKVHFRLFSPSIINCCFWGVDIPKKDELLAYKFKSKDNKEMAKELGVDSIKFISRDLFCKVFNENEWCHNCFIEHPTIISPQV